MSKPARAILQQEVPPYEVAPLEECWGEVSPDERTEIEAALADCEAGRVQGVPHSTVEAWLRAQAAADGVTLEPSRPTDA